MTKVTASEDCGNSPKNIFLQNINIALAKGDTQFLLGSVTDDIGWNIVGQKVFQGKESFGKALEEMNKDRVAEITIQHVSSHGKAGAVNGTTVLENGKKLAFCHVFEFSNTKGSSVRQITSYVITVG